MSAHFMLAIAAMYLAACVSFYIEGKYVWAVISICWGIGNALLALLSAK